MISLVLLCLPGSTIPRFPWLARVHADKVVHVVLFFILGFLFSRPFTKTSLNKRNREQWFLCIALSGLVYATIMEFVQEYWLVNRSFEYGDIVAGAGGCLLAYG